MPCPDHNEILKAHLGCLTCLVGVYIMYIQAELPVPESTLSILQSQCQELLDLSKDQEIEDIKEARNQLEELRNLARRLENSKQQGSEREFRGLWSLVELREEQVKDYEKRNRIEGRKIENEKVGGR
ncbi:MAG: hypothetical protein Q9221_007104 [Calogaya cf. arnoldii]